MQVAINNCNLEELQGSLAGGFALEMVGLSFAQGKVVRTQAATEEQTVLVLLTEVPFVAFEVDHTKVEHIEVEHIVEELKEAVDKHKDFISKLAEQQQAKQQLAK